jgi:predicted ester cyclase
MSAEENKATVREGVELLNRPDWADFVPDDEPWKQEHLVFRQAFADYHATIDYMVAEGDEVMVWASVRATHSAEFPIGELKGIAPTSKQVTWSEVWYQRYENGRSVEFRLLVDSLGRLQQLGVYPIADDL